MKPEMESFIWGIELKASAKRMAEERVMFSSIEPDRSIMSSMEVSMKGLVVRSLKMRSEWEAM